MKNKHFITTEEAKRRLSFNYYKLKPNKFKILLVVGFVVFCLVTPFTNWLILLVGRILNKSLWLYK